MTSRTNATARPRIGVSTYRERAAFGAWDQDSAVLAYDYVDCVVRVGGLPLLLPPIGDSGPGYAKRIADLAADAVAAVDGLVLAGGPDVDPARYGEQPHAETGEPRHQRDAWELALLTAALERDVPVLAICRGMQLLNIAAGGTLHQHLPEQPGATDHRAGTAQYATTQVGLSIPDALPGTVLGPSAAVSCYHHQAIAKLGAGLDVTGRAPDGTIEAVASADHSFVLGVQWHPEADRELRLFTAFVEAAARARAS